MNKLIDNIEEFEEKAKENFGNENDNFKYRVATNFGIYDIREVEYFPKDFSLSMSNLIAKNPYTQLTEVFSEYYQVNIFEHIKNQTDASFHLTSSDIGGVKIGNEDFGIIIPNGFGDGETEVIITNNDAHVPLSFYTSVKGNFNIYNYDCGNTVETTLNGKYMIYSGKQTVVFVKQN